MLFQRPSPFPTTSVYDDVVAGIRLGRYGRRRDDLDAVVERVLTVDGPNSPGRLVEAGPTAQLFARPADATTERYLTGRVG